MFDVIDHKNFYRDTRSLKFQSELLLDGRKQGRRSSVTLLHGVWRPVNLEIETAENIARGMPPAEAAASARRKLGNSVLIREEIYTMNTVNWIDSTWRDFRYGARLAVSTQSTSNCSTSRTWRPVSSSSSVPPRPATSPRSAPLLR